jgi:hypothetical protein
MQNEAKTRAPDYYLAFVVFVIHPNWRLCHIRSLPSIRCSSISVWTHCSDALWVHHLLWRHQVHRLHFSIWLPFPCDKFQLSFRLSEKLFSTKYIYTKEYVFRRVESCSIQACRIRRITVNRNSKRKSWYRTLRWCLVVICPPIVVIVRQWLLGILGGFFIFVINSFVKTCIEHNEVDWRLMGPAHLEHVSPIVWHILYNDCVVAWKCVADWVHVVFHDFLSNPRKM